MAIAGASSRSTGTKKYITTAVSTAMLVARATPLGAMEAGGASATGAGMRIRFFVPTALIGVKSFPSNGSQSAKSPAH